MTKQREEMIEGLARSTNPIIWKCSDNDFEGMEKPRNDSLVAAKKAITYLEQHYVRKDDVEELVEALEEIEYFSNDVNRPNDEKRLVRLINATAKQALTNCRAKVGE